jgi:hypothetical protein
MDSVHRPSIPRGHDRAAPLGADLLRAGCFHDGPIQIAATGSRTSDSSNTHVMTTQSLPMSVTQLYPPSGVFWFVATVNVSLPAKGNLDRNLRGRRWVLIDDVGGLFLRAA